MAATLTKKQLSKAIQMEAGKSINDSSFFARVRKKTESGELVRIGKGVYAKSNLPVFDYELFSPTAKDAHAFLMGEYLGRIEFAVYEVTILNRFLNHLIAGSTTIVDVPKEFCENIFYALQDRGFRNVLLNPTEDENYRYNHNDGETIIVKATSSRSPIDKKRGKVLLEKLLVDIVSDKRLRYFFEGAETGPAVEEIVTSYSLDYAKVRTYAKRRGCYEKLLQFIPEEVRKKYLMIDRVFKKEFYSVDGGVLSLRLIETVEGSENELPFYWWSIVENASGATVGKISLRLGHNYHSYWNGNVGYEVDEPYRGHHYAAIALKMILPLARAHDMDHLIISCDEDNAASYKTIERCGGHLLEISYPPEDWIYYKPGLSLKRIYRIEL